jgi:hypothetical protein
MRDRAFHGRLGDMPGTVVTPEFSVEKLERLLFMIRDRKPPDQIERLLPDVLKELIATLKGFDRRVSTIASELSALEKRVTDLDQELESKA